MNPDVRQLLEKKRAAVARACGLFGVERLDLFGSGVGEAFDPGHSDFDFVVTFRREAQSKAFDNYFGLKEALAGIFERPIDLITSGSVRNPYLAKEIRETSVTIYATSPTEAVE